MVLFIFIIIIIIIIIVVVIIFFFSDPQSSICFLVRLLAYWITTQQAKEFPHLQSHHLDHPDTMDMQLFNMVLVSW